MEPAAHRDIQRLVLSRGRGPGRGRGAAETNDQAISVWCSRSDRMLWRGIRHPAPVLMPDDPHRLLVWRLVTRITHRFATAWCAESLGLADALCSQRRARAC